MDADTGYLQFEFETPDGRRLGDDAFFERACEYERCRDATAEFLRAFVAWRDRLDEEEGTSAMYAWTPGHRHTLLRAAFRLAEADPQYVTLYAEFIERTDLEHEGAQPDHVDALVEKHGWTPEVETLLAARVTTASSGRGIQNVENRAEFDRENLPKPRHESDMFDQFFEHCSYLHHSEYTPENYAMEFAEQWGELLLDDEEFAAWIARVRTLLDS